VFLPGLSNAMPDFAGSKLSGGNSLTPGFLLRVRRGA
jgi:hypothetical protein